ncbi:hypothetical protein BH18ACI5_BH18ACI5_03380 [soil metagenome]
MPKRSRKLKSDPNGYVLGAGGFELLEHRRRKPAAEDVSGAASALDADSL